MGAKKSTSATAKGRPIKVLSLSFVNTEEGEGVELHLADHSDLIIMRNDEKRLVRRTKASPDEKRVAQFSFPEQLPPLPGPSVDSVEYRFEP